MSSIFQPNIRGIAHYCSLSHNADICNAERVLWLMEASCIIACTCVERGSSRMLANCYIWDALSPFLGSSFLYIRGFLRVPPCPKNGLFPLLMWAYGLDATVTSIWADICGNSYNSLSWTRSNIVPLLVHRRSSPSILKEYSQITPSQGVIMQCKKRIS